MPYPTSWLAAEEGAAANTNIAPVTSISDDTASPAESAMSTESASFSYSNVTALLALALNMVGDNDEIKDSIANTINAEDSM